MKTQELVHLLQISSGDVTKEVILLKKLLDDYEEESETIVLNAICCLSMNETHVKIDRYYEDWLPRYLNIDFFSLFRMTKETLQELLRRLHCMDKPYTGGQQPLPVEQQLLITLWWLGKGEVLASAADKFNVAISTVYNCTGFILDQLIQLQQYCIVWPDRNEVVTIENEFRQRSGYPGVIGAIDGCCIKIKAPLDQQDSYIDRSMNHSIKLQGVSTCQKIFTNINVGFPGSAHDSRVFRSSSLYEAVEARRQLHRYFPNDFHLVGDSAYPLRQWIMTPYKDNGNLTHIQRRHNTSLSQTRVVIEHTFGILKCRWRILKYVNVNSIAKIVKIIAACCVLHNFCYQNQDFWDDYVPEYYDDGEYDGGNDLVEAVNKRYVIARLLQNNR